MHLLTQRNNKKLLISTIRFVGCWFFSRLFCLNLRAQEINESWNLLGDVMLNATCLTLEYKVSQKWITSFREPFLMDELSTLFGWLSKSVGSFKMYLFLNVLRLVLRSWLKANCIWCVLRLQMNANTAPLTRLQVCLFYWARARWSPVGVRGSSKIFKARN